MASPSRLASLGGGSAACGRSRRSLGQRGPCAARHCALLDRVRVLAPGVELLGVVEAEQRAGVRGAALRVDDAVLVAFARADHAARSWPLSAASEITRT